MALGHQFRRLGTQAATFRRALFGTERDGSPVELSYNGGEWFSEGYYSAIQFGHQLEGLNLKETHQAVVRLPKPALGTPQFGKQIRIEKLNLTLQINEVAPDHPASTEWVLGCEGLNG